MMREPRTLEAFEDIELVSELVDEFHKKSSPTRDAKMRRIQAEVERRGLPPVVTIEIPISPYQEDKDDGR